MARPRLVARAVDSAGEALENFQPLQQRRPAGDMDLDQQAAGERRSLADELAQPGQERDEALVPARLADRTGAQRRVEALDLEFVGGGVAFVLAGEVLVELLPVAAVAVDDVLDRGLAIAALAAGFDRRVVSPVCAARMRASSTRGVRALPPTLSPRAAMQWER